MPLTRIPNDELREICRKQIEALERWLRDLMHRNLSEEYGANYFDSGEMNGNKLFRSEIRRHADKRIKEGKSNYGDKINTLLLDHLMDTVCKKDLYTAYFKDALEEVFPDGWQVARTNLKRLIPLRNALSHSNPISVRDAERVICYTNDVIDSIKAYNRRKNMDHEYNTPQFTRFRDSLGHDELITKTSLGLDFSKEASIHVGDKVRMEVEVDASFDPSSYYVTWMVSANLGNERRTGNPFVFEFLPRHVGEHFTFFIHLISTKDWHRHTSHDAQIVLSYKVLPPLD